MGSQENDNKIHWLSWELLCWPKKVGGMGFRDLGTFNLAMLPKQSWKIVHNPDSLITGILKARYYPQGEFMSAHIGTNPSYTWRSLLAGRNLLERGLVWRVGNSDQIDIRSHAWIPNHVNFKLTQPEIVPVELTKVSQLLLSQPKRWNQELIAAVFLDQDAESILGIPLTQGHQHVSQFWVYDQRGSFSVKSAYKCAWLTYLEEKGNQGALGYLDYNSVKQNVTWWNRLWKIKVQPKLRIFT